MSINGFLVIVVIPVIIYQQYRLRHVCQVLLLLQQAVPSQAIDFLVLTTPIPTTPQTAMSYQEFVSLFSNTYWLHMLGFVIVMIVIYKGVLYFLRAGPNPINSRITSTDIVLQIVCGQTSVYVKLLSLDGKPELITIRSNPSLTGLQVTGYMQPKVNYMWPANLVHDLTELATVLAPCARITLYQAFLLRNILTKEYLTFI